MTIADSVRTAFPELEEIRDQELRRQVLDVWVRAIEDSAYDDLGEIPWWPPAEEPLEGSATTIEHVRAVTRTAIDLADSLVESIGLDLDRDIVVAGALLHDISKLYELDGGEETGELHEWIPHPHYGVHVLADAGFSKHLQHIAVSHSPNSAVEPRTIEAEIVSRADEIAVQGLFWKRNGTLRPE